MNVRERKPRQKKFYFKPPCLKDFPKLTHLILMSRSSPQEVILGVLETCSKFTGEHQNTNTKVWFEMILWHGCSTVNLVYIFRTLSQKTLWRAASDSSLYIEKLQLIRSAYQLAGFKIMLKCTAIQLWCCCYYLVI